MYSSSSSRSSVQAKLGHTLPKVICSVDSLSMDSKQSTRAERARKTSQAAPVTGATDPTPAAPAGG
eukprot:8655999-Pyramimonas_sp.AAC.1